MPKQSVLIHALTVGEVSKEALSRVDLAKTRLAAETQVNLLPKTIGSAYFRPGFEYLSTAAGVEIMRPFAISSSRDAIIHFRTSNISVSVDGVMVTRVAVSSTVQNGNFAGSAGWTLTTTGSAVSTISGNQLLLQAVSQGSSAAASQSVTTTSLGVLHALRIVVARGSCEFRIGTTLGADDILGSTTIDEGTHSLSFTPTVSPYYIKFKQNRQTPTYLTNCQIEAAGVLSLPTSYGASDLRKIRVDQSGDIMFLACIGLEQRRIERRALYSWSVTRYLSNDGPLTLTRTAPVRLSVAELYGSTTMTASDDFFTSAHGGSLISLSHNKQARKTQLSADEEYTIPIRVAGIKTAAYNDRDWSYAISGTWAGTLKWSRAYGSEDGGYSEFRQSTTISSPDITANLSGVNDDDDNNAIVFYRLGFQAGGYTSGAATILVNYDGGTTTGIARIVSVSSPTSALVDILKPPGSSTGTKTWRAGTWSGVEGYPAAPSFYDGRLFFAGKDLFWGSVSDNYYSFDEGVEGDSAPIIRNMAVGRGVQQAKSMLPLSRLIILTEGCEIVAKSSNFDEPLTATGITLKAFSDYGSADDVPAVIAGNNGLFIDRTTKRMIEISDASGAGDYASDEVTKINRDILSPGVWDMAVQRNPDTRAWIAKTDGKGVVLTYDRTEEIVAFTPIETGGAGELQSVCVSRQDGVDRVTALFKRTINAVTVYTRERLALDSEIGNVTQNCQMDSYTKGALGSPGNVITGLSRLEGTSVSVWADGVAYPGPFVVTGGQITVTGTPFTNYVVGLPYEWRFKSAKLAYASGMGTPINQVKRVDKIGFQLNKTHNKGIQYGGDFNTLYDLPSLVDGDDVSNVIHDTYDHEMTMFNGQWGTDSRICLKGSSPYPCTVSGITFTVTTHDAG